MRIARLFIMVTGLSLLPAFTVFADERPRRPEPTASADNPTERPAKRSANRRSAAAAAQPMSRTKNHPIGPSNPGFTTKPAPGRDSTFFLSPKAVLPVNAWQRRSPATVGGLHTAPERNTAAINGTAVRRKQ